MACSVRSKPPCRVNSSSMWSKKRMPVRDVVAALAVDRQLPADLRLRRPPVEGRARASAAVAHRRLPRPASSTDLERLDARQSVCVEHARRSIADAARRAPDPSSDRGRARSRAASACDERRHRVADADEHVVRGALPVLEAEPAAGRVEPLARFARPAPRSAAGTSSSSSAACVAASATPLMLNGSVTARTGSSACGWPIDDADAHAGKAVRLRERPADEHVRVARQLAAGTSRRRTRCRPRRSSTTACGAASAIRSQVGERDQLAGRIVRRVEEDHPRPRRDRGDHRVGRKREVRARRHAHRRRADRGRRVRIRIERRQRHDRFGVVHARARAMWPTAAIRMPFVEAVGQQHPVGIDVEVRARRRARARCTTDRSRRRRLQRRIASSTRGEQPPVFSLRCSRSPSPGSG